MNALFKNYINTFRGLSTEVWWLALITLINRAGTMVIPFLTIYLDEDLQFTKPDIGWIMSFFGIGSLVGTWVGGKLTDKIGYYKVMFFSLFLTAVFFVLLQYATTFNEFCFGIFIVMLVADAFRPAMFVALNAYSKPENKTRSVTLIRLAINLGFSVGPAIGGIIIVSIGYQGLFWVDGITCALAGILLLNVLHPKKAKILDVVKVDNPVSAYKDKAFWVFFIAMFIFGFTFLQYFSTMPLYYKDVRMMSELDIGLLMGFNGFFIFVFEMPLINWLQKTKNSKIKLIAIGLFLVAISFFLLNVTSWIWIVVIGMLFMTIGEMIAFPFSNAFAVERAKKGNQGEYMALYAIAFSLSHIFSHNSGMQMVDKLGFETTLNMLTIFALVGVFILWVLMKILKKEKETQSK
ncbi:MFS transporter [Polaribacter aestuariivivens]|uniref:MFS transporter n=1 Tax=Polaribacter aestuariivivens TaxID=2304626 RepID=A0A5S3NA42_9FLAO|nr:MFS transporter [Polaribacter aestuariivivens]TMM32063.1 MFS transporter [Polaribacter aestuariivivens]